MLIMGLEPVGGSDSPIRSTLMDPNQGYYGGWVVPLSDYEGGRRGVLLGLPRRVKMPPQLHNLTGAIIVTNGIRARKRLLFRGGLKKCGIFLGFSKIFSENSKNYGRNVS